MTPRKAFVSWTAALVVFASSSNAYAQGLNPAVSVESGKLAPGGPAERFVIPAYGGFDMNPLYGGVPNGNHCVAVIRAYGPTQSSTINVKVRYGAETNGNFADQATLADTYCHVIVDSTAPSNYGIHNSLNFLNDSTASVTIEIALAPLLTGKGTPFTGSTPFPAAVPGEVQSATCWVACDASVNSVSFSATCSDADSVKAISLTQTEFDPTNPWYIQNPHYLYPQATLPLNTTLTRSTASPASIQLYSLSSWAPNATFTASVIN